MLEAQLWYLGKMFWYFLKKRSPAQTIVSLVFLLILASLAIISFISSKLFIGYVYSFESFSQVLLRFTLLSVTSALTLLSLISFTIAYLKTFYEKNLSLLILGSGSFSQIAFSVFVTTLIIGSWPFLLISLPFFLAFGLNIATLAIHLLLILITAALSGCLALIIQRLGGAEIKKLLPWLLLFGLGILYLLFTRVIYPSNLGLIASLQTLSEVETTLWKLPVASGFLPTTMFVDIFLGNSRRILDFILTTILSLLAFAWVVKILFKTSWQKNFEGYQTTQGKKINKPFIDNTSVALFQKEIYSLIRSQNSLIYFSFILFLTSILVFFLSQSKGIKNDYYSLTPLVRGASYFAVSYLLLLFTLRFVFPSQTLERSHLWLTITVSKIKEKILKSKWLFYQIVSFIFILLLTVLTGNNSNLLVLTSLSILLTTLALTLGGIFIRFLPKQDTEAIATTTPGLLLTIASLIIGALMSWLLLTNYASSLPLILLVFSFSIMMMCFSLVKKKWNTSLDI